MRRLVAISAIGVLLSAACGGGGDDASDAQGAGGHEEGQSTMAGGGGAGEHAEHGGPDVTATCSPSGTTISIVATNTEFNTACLAAPADQPFTLTYDNRDSAAHNIAILESHSATDVLFRADIFSGPKVSTFEVQALKPGTFAFHCEVHPSQMKGTFIVA